jgi:hypothetical protein
VNLYVLLPRHQPFLQIVFGAAPLAAHSIVAALLLGTSVGALVRAIRSGAAIPFTSIGLVAVLVAGIAGGCS